MNDMFWSQPPRSLAELEAACQAKWNVTRLADASSPLDRSAIHNRAAFSSMVFSNNLLDPASSGGIKVNVSDTLLAVNTPMYGHHVDLMFSDPTDTPELIAARRFEIDHLLRWATDANDKRRRTLHRVLQRQDVQ